MGQWPHIEHETLPWHGDPDLAPLISKTQRRKIGSAYEAALPLHIEGLSVDVPAKLSARMSELLVRLAQFDAQQQARGYDLPALLLRSESSASSQIEHLTSSVRNVALAEVSRDVPRNARLIMGNVAAMREALLLDGPLDLDAILAIHAALMNRDGATFGGKIREEQVWVGGGPYSPHGALYVPPAASRVPDYLDDLVAFAARADLTPIVKAALLHAQLETIHPFIDGNGRTGRVLIHKILAGEGILSHATLPLSAGLLHNVGSYMDALTSYQQGDPLAVIEQLVEALEFAVSVGALTAKRMDETFASWFERIGERRGSSIYRLPELLSEQPVVSVSYVADGLGITTRAALTLVNRACEYGMLRPLGNRRRGDFYQSDEIIDLLEPICDAAGLRRLLAGE